MEPSLGEQGFELLLVEDIQLQLLRLLQLRARARTGNHVVRLRAHAPDGLAPELPDERLGVGPAHELEGAGEDKRLASERTVAGGLDGLRSDPHGEELLHQLTAGTLEVGLHLVGHVRPDASIRRRSSSLAPPTRSTLPKSAARSCAVASPTCGMPSANRKRHSSGRALAAIRSTRFCADLSANPSSSMTWSLVMR